MLCKVETPTILIWSQNISCWNLSINCSPPPPPPRRRFLCSTLGQGLQTSTFPGEVIFSIALAIFGLILFALLIGNMQVNSSLTYGFILSSFSSVVIGKNFGHNLLLYIWDSWSSCEFYACLWVDYSGVESSDYNPWLQIDPKNCTKKTWFLNIWL